jgi:hypothetical protein
MSVLLRPHRPLLAVGLAAVLAVPALAACGDSNRPPKPSCPAGQHADWDDDDAEWECERDSSGNNGNGGSSGRTRRR